MASLVSTQTRGADSTCANGGEEPDSSCPTLSAAKRRLMRAYGSDGRVRLDRIGGGGATHYIVAGNALCGVYTRGQDEPSDIEVLPAKEREHIEASCSWCRGIAEDDAWPATVPD